jgi:hypothetical protein
MKLIGHNRPVRMLLQRLCHYASAENLAKLEKLWRDAVTDWVMQECRILVQKHADVQVLHDRCRRIICLREEYTDSQVPPASPSQNSFRKAGSEPVYAKDPVRCLVDMLKRARTVSRMELAESRVCFMSADFAFQRAFQRLPKEISVELAKVLAVRMSSLLDAHR